MNRYYSQQKNDMNLSFDVFASPPKNRSSYYSHHDVFRDNRKRRSSGESNDLPRAIRKALDPEYDYSPSIDYCEESTSSNRFNYHDDASILAAVSSAHSSQETPGSIDGYASRTSSKSARNHSKELSRNRFNPIFSSGSSGAPQNKAVTMDDFLSPDEIEGYRKQSRRHRPKQIRMDEYLFKARRVDKGAREFGLHTTHEPKRGSKKKRDSIELLEVENIEVEEPKKKEVLVERNVDNLDFSLAFGSPSPARKRSKESKLTSFFGKKSGSQPTTSNGSQGSTASSTMKCDSNDSFLEDRTCSSPNRSILVETMPLCTPSPKKKTLPRSIPFPTNRDIFQQKIGIQKRKQYTEQVDLGTQPLVQHKRKKHQSSNKQPEFDYPSSPITLEDDVEVKPKPEILRAEEAHRKKFAVHVNDREQFMRQLVDEKFKDGRENGGIEQRRAELKEGQVIRNKEMRKNLMHGASCKCCHKYYDGLDMGEQEKKDYINKVSRHRYVHKALPDTPEKYWDLTLGPCDEEEERLMTQQRDWEKAAKKLKEKTVDVAGIHNWN